MAACWADAWAVGLAVDLVVRKAGYWVDAKAGGWVDQWAVKKEHGKVVAKVAHWVAWMAEQMGTPAVERSVGDWAERSVAARDDWRVGCSAERSVSRKAACWAF